MYLLDEQLWFPDPTSANSEGLLALGGDLSTERLILAYKNGIFPWFNEESPILWWSPAKRMVVYPNSYVPPKSLTRFVKKCPFQITFNEAFDQVIHNCRSVPRKNQDGTWITRDIISAYKELHRLGYAKSVEVWLENQLVGGLYGVDLGHVFTGESMFSLKSNASKSAFVFLVEWLKQRNYALLDCQIYNDHLALLGAKEIDRSVFLQILRSK